MGVCGDRTLVSPDLGSDSLELANCMVDPRKTYGEMACLWGSGVTYGEMRQACSCMGKLRYHMGRWPVYGRSRNRMGNESRMKNRNMEAGGDGSAWGPPDRMGSLSQWQTWRDLRALRIFATTGSAARVWAPPDWTALLVHCSIFGGFHSFQALVNSGDLCRSLFKSVF